MPVCSGSCANRYSSRPPPPTCSRSSAARPSICRRCSTHWSSSAARLCDADKAFIFRREGAGYRLAANFGFSRDFKEYLEQYLIEPSRHTLVGRTSLERRTIHIPDVLADPEYTWSEAIERGGLRTLLGIPLLREGVPIGVFQMSRATVRPFTDKQIELMTTFADQAVIAIENVRLFEAEQQRTRELAEALEQQTATSEVLQVISSSPGELEPVFQAMLEKATRICEASFGNLLLYDGAVFRHVALHNAPQTFAAETERDPVAPPTLGALPLPRRRHQAGRPYCRRRRGQSGRADRHPGGSTHPADRSDAQGGRTGGGDRRLSPGGPPVRRQAGRAGQELRRTGGYRHREHAALQRTAPAHRRPQ